MLAFKDDLYKTFLRVMRVLSLEFRMILTWSWMEIFNGDPLISSDASIAIRRVVSFSSSSK